jgi:hypothetical protein
VAVTRLDQRRGCFARVWRLLPAAAVTRFRPDFAVLVLAMAEN